MTQIHAGVPAVVFLTNNTKTKSKNQNNNNKKGDVYGQMLKTALQRRYIRVVRTGTERSHAQSGLPQAHSQLYCTMFSTKPSLHKWNFKMGLQHRPMTIGNSIHTCSTVPMWELMKIQIQEKHIILNAQRVHSRSLNIKRRDTISI